VDAVSSVLISLGAVDLEADVAVPEGARGMILFAHGSGSSRRSPRNMQVAEYLRSRGRFGTVLFDLLTAHEDEVYERRFDIGLLGRRLDEATDWLRMQDGIGDLDVGYFGASTGAAAAIVAAASRDDIAAIVSRGGRPDLAGEALRIVTAPTLLIVGSADLQVLDLNRAASTQMPGTVELMTVPGATHLFEEPGTLEQASFGARAWFERYVG
jgi:putative phosphoribosyl transferase